MPAKKKAERIEITPPNFQTISARVEGVAPLMLHKFSEKMRKQIEEKQTATDKVRKKRESKDYRAEYLAARYLSTEGWEGVPAGSFRNAMISACRDIDGLTMVRAKCAFFLLPDGHDSTDGTPLIKLVNQRNRPIKGAHDTRPVRLESGVADMRNRPRYDSWECELQIQYDADIVSASDVLNLLARAGAKYGIGELRPNAKKGFGGDFGLWAVRTSKAKRAAA